MLKDYLNRLWAVMVRLQTHDEEMMIAAFEQGIAVGPFSDSLIRNSAETFSEVLERVITHIEMKETVLRKNYISRSRQPRPNESNLDWPMRVNETSAEKRTDSRYVPYVAKKDEPKMKAREESTTRPKFRVSYKEHLSMPGVADKLKFPQKTDRSLRSQRDAWCEFHKAFGHNVERCIALGHQLASLVKKGFLKEYLEANQEKPKGEVAIKDQAHEIPVH